MGTTEGTLMAFPSSVDHNETPSNTASHCDHAAGKWLKKIIENSEISGDLQIHQEKWSNCGFS